MKNLSKLAASIVVALTASSSLQAQQFSVKHQTATGQPAFVVGELGKVHSDKAADTLHRIIASQAAFGVNGNEGFKVKRQWTDELGKSHTHFTQTINGLNVYGTSMILHANAEPSVGPQLLGSATAGDVYAVSGQLALSSDSDKRILMLNNKAMAQQAKTFALAIGNVLGKAELSYVYLPMSEDTRLVWRMEVEWDNGPGDFGRDFVYFDANTAELVARHAQVHSAKSRRTYTLNGGSAQSAPGTLLCTDNQSCGGNAAAQRAHDGAGKVYDYYMSKFNRDSLNGSGMALVSSVDMGESNAYWTGSQMIYGHAANGLNDFTSDFDIIGHELTHGVTQHTANLVYQNASGALNEAWSDILGLSAESYKNGTTTSTWLLGDGLYNNQPGKAFRYMNNPTQDNYSKDYWPERIPYSNNPNNQNDYGGVHGNSGIANLAYVLLVDGGTHPRNKTTVQVPSIGMAKAEQIFYRALNTYMNQSTNFAGARTATAQAAQDLYGATEKTAVETAWCAVGVGTCPSDPTDPTDPPTGSELQNGVAKTSISASTGQDVVYTLDVPAGATNISFSMSGGSGDADMYVKFGSTPTDSSYDCRPYQNGNNESCTGTQTGGKYYVRLKAYSAFSGVSLTGSYSGGGTDPTDPTNPTPIDETLSNLSVGTGQWSHYYQDLGTGYSSLTISISGGFGDVDLYTRKGAQPNAGTFDCRPYKNGNNEACTYTNPTSGRYNIGLYGYSSASGVSLRVQAD